MLSGSPLSLMLVASVAVIGYGIVSVLRVDAARWHGAGRKRRNWVLLMLVFGPLAVLLFHGTVRQQLLHPERYEVVDGVAPVDG